MSDVHLCPQVEARLPEGLGQDSAYVLFYRRSGLRQGVVLEGEGGKGGD